VPRSDSTTTGTRLVQVPAGSDAPTRYEIECSSPSGAEVLRSARIELAGRLRVQRAEHREALVAHVLAVAPNDGAEGDQLLSVGPRETIEAWIDCCLAAIELGSRSSEPIPSAVGAHVHRAASSGISLTTALRRCVAGHALAWRCVLRQVARLDLPDEMRFALLREVSFAMSSMLASIEVEIADAHSVEIKRRACSREQRRAEIVRRLLASEPMAASELAELGYDLNAWHVAVIAKGAGGEKAVRTFAAALGRQLLACPQDATTVWAWLGGEDRLAFPEIDRLQDRYGPADTFIAVGESGRGIDGWRATHQEAQGALLVALGKPSRVTRYLDVALDAAALQDHVLADSLIEKYLSPLDDVAIGGQAARRTIRALFDTEHNASSAANALKVHRSSVHRWRDQIEQRLGYRLYEHQAEIELALRIEELRGGRVPSATARA
jgi:hypothetical protein